MLSPYRVLDLSDERGLLCGQILADLGADVIAVEPPGGSRARRIGPFLRGDTDPEGSLVWSAYARNKRSVALDLDGTEDRGAFLRLAGGADFLIESDAPGAMAARGLGYADLAARNPGLVYVSISPFGQDGPKAGYAATDLIVQAASGSLVLSGDPDRAPLRTGGVTAWAYAGAEAAGAALVAHFERVRSGRGQHVDVSAQLAANLAAAFTFLSERIRSPRARRSGAGVAVGKLRIPYIWPAADGFVSLTLAFDGPNAAFLRRLFDWMAESGALDAAARERDWRAYLGAVLTGQAPRDDFDALLAAIGAFLRARTKRELLEGAVERRLLLAPVATIPDVLASPQLRARAWWRPHAVAGAELAHPGPFARFERTPLAYRRGAPRLGEHNREILSESPRAPARAGGGAPARAPLEGIRILDFMWVMAGPWATRVLADYGATVIKVEFAGRLDLVRVLPPFYGGQPGPENSASFGSINAGKRSLGLDLGKPAAREVVLDLVRWADAVTEAYAPGAMQRFGLDYASLVAVKPDLVMLSTCLFGQTGPLSGVAGYGTMAAAFAGFVQPTGWPDRPPCGPFGPYTDWIAPRFTVAALLAALDHRRRTGEGQYVDQSQAESALHFLAPWLLDCAAGAPPLDRVANRDRELAPHGVYPAAGDDEWIALAARDERDWGALCAVLAPALASDARFATLAARRANADALDLELGAATRAIPGPELEQRLQAAGVPAHVVMHSGHAGSDRQLAHRGHFIEAPHAVHGRAWVESTRFRLSRTPAAVERAGPALGQDTDYVLREVLGYSDARIAELRAAGATA
jgi:crotonobetainyl-CoA:carnitine CoA-transferase CaiB-like acyl-CoA transferase